MSRTVTAAVVGLAVLSSASRAQTVTLSKGNQILITQGLQVQGMVSSTDPFHLGTYQAANYSAVNWIWDSNTPAGGGPAGGSPTNWYGDLRRYRVYAGDYDIPLATYRQTFHDSITRDPSPSEQRLNTFAALAFNVKYFSDFTYNSGASSLFNNA